MEINYHLHVKRLNGMTRIAVADEEGVVIDAKEFYDRPDGRGNREIEAHAWAMSVLIGPFVSKREHFSRRSRKVRQ